MRKLRTRTMVVQIVGSVYVTVNAAESPSDDEWDRKLELYRSVPDLTRMRILVSTVGGSPNTRQRARLNALLGDLKLPQAVMTNSALARAAGTAISWFQPTFRMFGLDQLEAALDHIALPLAERPELRRALDEMRAELYGAEGAALPHQGG